MTREEIISNLLYMKRSVKEDTIEDRTIDEAIKALEQEPCEDAVDRDTIIREMEKRHKEGDAITIGYIKNLPPVTPKPLDDVIDEIRAEIKSKKFGLTDTEDGRRIQSDIHAGFDGGIECALQIIDKYKAESEGKE